MAITLPSSVTGAAQTGFTTPGYTTTVDTPPGINAKQVAVTAITGTQAGVDATSVARPFTIAFFRPLSFAVLGKPNPVTGLLSSFPVNVYKLITRKGVTVLAGQPNQIASITSSLNVPAGSDVVDPANLRAMISAHIGTLTSISAGLGDTANTGVA